MDFSKFKNEIQEVENWLSKEFSTIRTGMASPALLDGVKVDSYGSLVPLNQIASVGAEDARTLRITPWDLGQVKDIEKAITDADLGVSISADSGGVRVSFPELTSERRILLLKTAKEKLEKARVSLRAERDKIKNEIQNIDVNEDEERRLKDEMQKLVDEKNIKLEEMFNKKEAEISV